MLVLLTLGWVSVAGAEPGLVDWSRELQGYRIPNFVGKSGVDSARVVLVEVLFRNTGTEDCKLVLGADAFQVTTGEGKPAEIVGLIYRPHKMEGATQIQFVGRPPKKVEKLTEDLDDFTVAYAVVAASIEATVPARKTYRQRLLLARPADEQSVRVKFADLPPLVISLPK